MNIVVRGILEEITGKGKFKKLLVNNGISSLQCCAFKGYIDVDQFSRINRLERGEFIEVKGKVELNLNAPEGWEIMLTDLKVD